MGARLSLADMQARVAAGPRRLGLDEMQALIGNADTAGKRNFPAAVPAPSDALALPTEAGMLPPAPGDAAIADVLPGRRFDPTARPLFDPAHDTIRAFRESLASLKRHAAEAFPPPPPPSGEGVLGAVRRLPGELAQLPGRFVSAAAMPLDALGMAMAPLTGAARATAGSLASFLPAMTKEKADQAVDLAMMGAGPSKAALPRMAPADLEALRAIPGKVRLSLAEFQDRLRTARESGPPERIEPVVDLPGLRPPKPAAETSGPTERPGSPAGDAAASPASPPAPDLPARPTPPAEPPARNAGQPEFVVTPRGRRVEVRPEIVEAHDLVTSLDDAGRPAPGYPEALQPRDRSRAASRAQIQDIAANLQPELLGRSPSADTGAPIVGRSDNFVESGNGRVLAIRRAYAEGLPSAERYRAWLAGQGFDVAGFKAPVLIRRRVTELDDASRAAFAAESNERPTLALSASEQALADARTITPEMLATYQGGDLAAAGNRKFVRAFVERTIPASERGAALTADGQLSQAGYQRIQNALFARAYGDGGLLAALREAPDTNIRGIGEAMADASPLWAKMRGEIEAGRVPPEVDPTKAVLEAARIVQRARETGVPVANALRQGDMFAPGVSPDTEAALRLFFRDEGLTQPRARPKIAEALRVVADQAARNEAGPGLFPDAPKITAADILRLARERMDGGLLPEVADSRVPMGGRETPRRLTLDRMQERVDALPETAAMQPGGNYLAMRPQTYDPAVVATGRPIRREDILRPLFKDIGLPLYEGRIKSKETLGFFRKSNEEIRIRHPADIETAAHEIAHALDKRFPEIRQQWLPATKANAAIRAELSGVSYDRTKLYEGFAEFVRLWATNTAEAQKRAPEFFRWFEQWVDRSPHAKALRDAQRGMTQWFEQAALDRARSKIGEVKPVNAFLDAPSARFRQAVFDDLHGILRMERTLTGGLAPTGAYETARLSRGAAAMVDGALRFGAPRIMPDGSHRFVGEGLEQILKPVAGELDDFLLYAVGRSAKELAGQGREHLFSPAEIKAMVALERPAFRRAFDKYQAWNAAILDFAEAKGLIDPAVRALWRRADYLPFHRVGQPGADRGAVPGDWRGIKALTGGSENLREVLGNMVGNARMLIEAALINEARLKVADLAQREGGARFMAKIPREGRVVRVPAEEVERAIIEALGVRSKAALPTEQRMLVESIVEGMRPMAEFLLHNQAPGGHNVVAALRHGRPEYYEVADPILFRALTALNRPLAPWAVRLAAIPKRIGQATVTLAADFLAANFARDTLMGAVMSRHGFKPILDSAIGMASRLRRDQNYRDFIANGGGMASHLLDEGALRSHLARFYSGKGIDYRTVLDAPGKLLFGLERIAESFEIATRLGEYRRAIMRGEHPRHAAYAAREVSTDFAMRGDSAMLGFFYDTVMFLKAGMNGMDRLYRGLAQDPNKGAIAAKAGIIAAMSAALYALFNRGNPLYEQLEDWDKDTHWHFFVPRPEALQAEAAGRTVALKDRYLHLKYPKIWEIGALASLAERSMAGILDGLSPRDATAMLKTLGRAFNLDYLPQAVKPLAEVAMNRNRFLDRPIETEGMEELQPWARSAVGGSLVLRRAGEATRDLPEAVQINPARAEHLLRGYFNTFALYGLSLADGLLYDSAPDLRADQYPVLRRFYAQEPARRTRYETELFDAIKAATEARRTMRFLDDRWRPDLAGELENREDNRLYGQAQHVLGKFRVFRREAEQVLRAEGIEPLRRIAEERARLQRRPELVRDAVRSGDWEDVGALKRFLLDDLTAERNAFAESAWRDMEASRRALRAQAGTRP